jgi:hypothetical protein
MPTRTRLMRMTVLLSAAILSTHAAPTYRRQLKEAAVSGTLNGVPLAAWGLVRVQGAVPVGMGTAATLPVPPLAVQPVVQTEEVRSHVAERVPGRVSGAAMR